jgi:hypothetical protein
MFSTTRRTSAKRGATALLLAAGIGTALLFSQGLGAPAAHACGIFGCDRPATPAALQASSDDPGSLTLSWLPTANEEVCYEFIGTENGANVDLTSHEPHSYVTPLRTHTADYGRHTGCVYGGAAEDRLIGERQQYIFTGLDYGATYCVQMRARDWNDGDPQSGYVSADWSDASCATTLYPSLFPSVTPPVGTPATPSGLTVVSRGAQYIELGWSYAAAANRPDAFTIYRDGQAVGTVPSSDPTYLFTDAFQVVGTHHYSYKVCATFYRGDLGAIENCSPTLTTDLTLVLSSDYAQLNTPHIFPIK